jgi:hypothetical protein
MKIKEISYERVHNLGNYETERFGAVASVDDKEDSRDAFKSLKNFVEYCLFEGE